MTDNYKQSLYELLEAGEKVSHVSYILFKLYFIAFLIIHNQLKIYREK